MGGVALQKGELGLLLGRNPGCLHGFPSVLGCRPCVRRAAVQRRESPCRGCQSPGDGSRCDRGSPRSRWSEGRPSRGSSSRRITRRECPLFNVSQAQWVSWKTETKQERGRKKETGGTEGAESRKLLLTKVRICRQEGLGRHGAAHIACTAVQRPNMPDDGILVKKVSLLFCHCAYDIFHRQIVVALCGLYGLPGQLCYGQSTKYETHCYAP